MHLYLVRHGEALSSPQEPTHSLSAKGETETKQLRSFLAPLNLPIQQIWHSGKARAKQTAEILAEGFQTTLIEKAGLQPEDPVEPIFIELQALREDILIVGHLPFLEKFISYALLGDSTKQLLHFENSSIVALNCAHNPYKLEWMISPTLF